MPYRGRPCGLRHRRLVCLVDRRTNCTGLVPRAISPISYERRERPVDDAGAADSSRRGSVDRRQFLALMGLGVAAVAGGGALAACSTEPGSTGTATNTDAISAVLPKFKALDVVKPDI